MTNILDQLKQKYLKVHDALDLDRAYLLSQKLDEIYIDAFSNGIDSLFHEIMIYQPLTFQKLKECKGFHLLERERPGGKDGNHFEVALTYGNGLVTGKFTQVGSYKRRTPDRIVPSRLAYIPMELRCYYDFCEGLNIPKDNNPAGIMNYVLAGSVTTFDDLDDWISEDSLDKNRFGDLIDRDVLVWCQDPEKRYMLVEKESHRIFDVDYSDGGGYRELDDPVREIDIYFSKSIENKCC